MEGARLGTKKVRIEETIHWSLATITPSWEGAGGWVMEGARPGTKKVRIEETIHRSLATITPSWEGAGGWVMEGARPGTKKVRIFRFSLFLCPEQDSNLHSLAATSP